MEVVTVNNFYYIDFVKCSTLERVKKAYCQAWPGMLEYLPVHRLAQINGF